MSLTTVVPTLKAFRRKTSRLAAPSAVSVAPAVLGRLGDLEVRLATTADEINAAQALRYEVFYREMKAKPSPLQRITKRDADIYDRHCDHLLVVDRAQNHGAGRIVGTYRLLPQDRAGAAGGFYSAGEFDIGPMLARHPGRRFLELGRSCVLPAWRGKRTVELLWHGIWAYALRCRADVMFGCASLPGTDAQALSQTLGLLREAALAPPEWQCGPQAPHGRRLPVTPCIDTRNAMRDLPPLVKGYLRIGGYLADGAVVDYSFNTTDVFVVLPMERINARYVAHYGADAGRYARDAA